MYEKQVTIIGAGPTGLTQPVATEGGIHIRQGSEDGDVVVVALPASLSDGQTMHTTSEGFVVR